MKMMSPISRRCLHAVKAILLLSVVVAGQQQDPYGDYPDYNDYAGDYGQDNLYSDYATHKDGGGLDGALGGGGGGGIGLGKFLLGSAVSWFVGGKFHAGRTAKKLKSKFQKEQKQLYSQYYNDVYKLTEQNHELQVLLEQLQDALRNTEAKHELEQLQRDYDEFKQPDIDGDDRISRAEFNMYVKNYLSHYPGLSEKDYPKFEDFDHDGDGYVGFQEYAQQMALQVKKAEQQQAANPQQANQKHQALSDMYGDTKSGGNFNDVYSKYGKV